MLTADPNGWSDASRARWLYPLLLSALTLISFVLLLRAHLGAEDPLGADGYYYAVQLRELLSSGDLYYPGGPVAFFLLAPFAALFGPILGVKVGAPFFAALTIPLAANLVKTISRDMGAALLSGLSVACSLGFRFLSCEFIKQSIGIPVLLLCLTFAFRCRGQWTVRRLLVLVILSATCLLTHPTSAALAAWFGIPLLIGSTKPGSRKWLSVIGALVLMPILGATAIWPRREVLSQLFKPIAEANSRFDLRADCIAAGVALMALAILIAMRYRRLPPWRDWLPFLLGPATFTIVLNLPWLHVSDQGLILRLVLLGFVPLCLLLPMVVVFAGRGRQARLITGVLALVPLIVIAGLGNDRREYSPAKGSSPALAALTDHVPDDASIITLDSSIAFQVTWFSGLKASSLPPRDAEDVKTFRLLSSRTAWAKRGLSDFASTMPPDLPKLINPLPEELHHHVVLIPESTWNAFVAASPEIQEKLDRYQLR